MEWDYTSPVRCTKLLFPELLITFALDKKKPADVEEDTLIYVFFINSTLILLQYLY